LPSLCQAYWAASFTIAGARKSQHPFQLILNQSGQADSTGVGAGTVTGKTFEVKEGNSIQEAVGKAKPGDLIRIYPGVYHETVYIDKDNISIQGVIENGEWPVPGWDRNP